MHELNVACIRRAWLGNRVSSETRGSTLHVYHLSSLELGAVGKNGKNVVKRQK